MEAKKLQLTITLRTYKRLQKFQCFFAGTDAHDGILIGEDTHIAQRLLKEFDQFFVIPFIATQGLQRARGAAAQAQLGS